MKTFGKKVKKEEVLYPHLHFPVQTLRDCSALPILCVLGTLTRNFKPCLKIWCRQQLHLWCWGWEGCEPMSRAEIILSVIKGRVGALRFALTSDASSPELLGAFWAYASHYCSDLSWIALGSVSAQSTPAYIENRITFYFLPQEANWNPQSRI